jgi:hypothetical protein
MKTSRLLERQHSAIRRIAALVLVNAMMFQEVLAQKNERVRPLQDFRLEPDPVSAFADHWSFILEEINYCPIFNVALQLIRCITSGSDATNAAKNLIGIARQIVDWRASLRHDLAGRIYHRILAEAKYLGAYYTSIPAAALLAKLALGPDGWATDWSDPREIGHLRVADLACGTGTLLMAAADVITDNHIYASVVAYKKPRLGNLHKVVNEQVLIGFDVLQSAVHLTASTLALRVPDVEINLTNLSTLPFAAGHDELGSFEFFPTDTVRAATLFGQHPERVRGTGPEKGPVRLPLLDLCIMNPPFTSSRQPNLLFGSIPETDRAAMQKRLKKLVKDHNIPASITAGLAAVFVALGDKYLKEGGRLALVLPRSILAGVAWGTTRRLLERKYQVEYIVVSHEPDHWNFSENTQLSEVLIVAKKLKRGTTAKADVKCVNLWRNPRNTVDALALSRAIQKCAPPNVHHLKGPANLTLGSAKFGEAVTAPQSELSSSIWVFPYAYAQSELLRTFYALKNGVLVTLGHKETHKLPMVQLETLGELGPDPRDVYDGYSLTAAKTSYPALWGHPVELATLSAKPNQYLEPRSEAMEGRNLRDADLLWPRAGCVLITMRSWLKTKRMVALRLNEKVLSDVWWPFSFKKAGLGEDAEKALVLWLNSTLGVILLLAYREETRGAWVQFKKPVLGSMPVLDFSALGSKTLRKLATAYDRLHSSLLLPLPKMGTDSTRAKIDASICDILKLPTVDTIRRLLGQEPLITLDMRSLSGN